MTRLSRQQLRENTRERLRNSAVQTFARLGVGGASVDVLTEAAGFSRGAFYSNYQSKQELLLELVAEANERELRFWEQTVAEDADLEVMFERLRERFENYSMSTDWGLLNIEIQLEAERDEAFGKAHRGYDQALSERTERLIGALFAKAERSPPADLAIVTTTFRSLVRGLTFQRRHATNGALANADMLILVLKGLVAISPPL